MITQVYQFKNLPQEYKNVLNTTLEGNQFVYVIKDNSGAPKSITTNICQAIKKSQSEK